jgi:hypothetical protein
MNPTSTVDGAPTFESLADFRGEVLERLRVIVVAGIAVGVVVGGVGSRAAMLVLRLTSPDHVRGVTSDDGFTIGRVTLSGTYNLLLLGAAVGIIGAAAYRVVAPWLIGPRWFRYLTTGAASGAVVGSMLLHSDGIDFTLLKPTWLAIALFIALPAVFGTLVGIAVDRVAATGSRSAAGRRRWVVPALLLVCFPPTIVLALVAGAVLTVWVALQSTGVTAQARGSLAVGLVVRGAWLAIALAGLLALLHDIDEIA